MGWKVTVERNTLRFSAAHFTTFRGDCEPLHGHNYQVIVEAEGELSEDSWVIDFSELKELTRRLCRELDHRFLLQRHSRVLQIEEGTDAWTVRFDAGQGRGRRWVFPKAEVVALPIDNTTAERLAEWFCGRLLDQLRARGVENVSALTVGIEEAPGQAGWYRAQLR